MLRCVVDVETDSVSNAVEVEEVALPTSPRVRAAEIGPRRVEGGVRRFDEPEPGEPARDRRAGAIAHPCPERTQRCGALRRRLRIAHELIDLALLGSKLAAHGNCA